MRGGGMSGHLPAMEFSVAETVRERCRRLHLPTWRLDTGGTIVDEPTEKGLAGLWLRTPQVQALVRAGTADASGGEPRVVTPMEGCWLIPLVEESRRRRTGLTVAMALGPAMLKMPLFAGACRSAGLDEQTARTTFAEIATHDEASVAQASAMLHWMVRDLAGLGEYQEAVRGFTGELTQSYETIDLLYALGRSMLDLDHPEKFVNLACDRLHETMPFRWMAAWFTQEELAAVGLTSSLVVRGQRPLDDEALAEALGDLAEAAPADMRSFLSCAREGLGAGTEARLLVQPIARGGELAGLMICGDKHGDDRQVSSYDMQLLEAAAAFTGSFLENARLYREQQALFMGSLKSLTAAIDAKDRYTCGHSERVALLAAQLARAMGMDEARAEKVHICGLVHDVGKIGVPERVLCKPGRLTESELELVKRHPVVGARIIRDIPMLGDILGGVTHHHERWDGKGYPDGLRGEEIPLFARLIGLADTFDAMSSTRSYRGAMSRAEVLAEIADNAGTQFDPALTKAFLQLDLRGYDALVARHAAGHGSDSAASRAA
jgi:HD-GYP domain-containing protein (c-di-GMP phosphodiesterase class II)